METKTEFQAYGKAGSTYGDTPSEAAVRYFEEFPKSRKCNVTEGVRNEHFFTVTYGVFRGMGKWPRSFRDVTKKQAPTLGEQDE